MSAASPPDRSRARPPEAVPARDRRAPARRTVPALARLGAALAALALAGCMSVRTAPLALSFAPPERGVSFSTEPPGARVVVDGRDSGFVTPCALRIDKGDWHRIELRLRGYRTAVRIVHPSWQIYTLKWEDMDRFGPRTFRFPFWLGIGEVLMPARYVSRSKPSRIHVELELVEPELDPDARLELEAEEDGAVFDPTLRRLLEPDEPGPVIPWPDEEPPPEGPEEIDPDILELLEELGYVGEPPAEPDEPDRR